jgi:hypothetical protein
MTTFVKLYVQGESSKMPVVYDRFGTNELTNNRYRRKLGRRKLVIEQYQQACRLNLAFSRYITRKPNFSVANITKRDISNVKWLDKNRM